ncbi:uncharacterized protein MKK02DRAFT_40480 [Dioszegia hungarica]|uniref:Xylanolytic transcriptional activator regulatory domain-containing protein n=1 Tax=Dioszegia hungarica TaxID=4972 RepID=A0AA38H1U5_9TREE|nr:uncharacterized protein MKK02DRAFT_40480 [Dioszegia hungarica]KAI9632181.1 hypothetical protein MKK02DRAFT_40480 [Dioszegia hungarica]
MCNDTARACTFDFAPPPRPVKPKVVDATEESIGSSGRDMGEMAEEGGTGSPELGRRGSEVYSPAPAQKRARWNAVASGSGSQRKEEERGEGTGKRAMSGLDILTSAVPSFDHLASSKYDPHVLTVVLTDDLLPIADPNDEVPAGHGEPHVKQISSDPSRPIFVIMNPKADTSQQPVPGAVALGLLRTFLRHHPSEYTEAHLLGLYHEHVHPALPILPNLPTDSLSPALLAMVLTTSMSHSFDTRSIAAPSYAVLEAGSTPLPENNLAGVASAVLELGVRPVNSSRSAYILLAKTVALAQLLGMHLNPLKWAIPLWEQELRIRLWWVLAIHDAWMSFLNSRPALIQANNNSVPLPTFSSLSEAGCTYGSASSDSAKSFIASCRLGLLVRRLQSNVCTLNVVASKSSAERRDEVLAIAKKADGLYDEWRAIASGTRARATGVNSFLIHLLGFRCMLRRIHLELEYGLGSTFTPGPDVLAPFTDCVNFVTRLTREECDGYYLNYASHILSSVTSSLTRLTLASASTPNQPAMDLLASLVRALHRFQTEYKWDIAVPALRRAAAVEARLKSIGEHEAVVTALRGGDIATPFDLDAVLQNMVAGPAPAVETEPQLVWDWSGLDWNFGDVIGADLGMPSGPI